MDLARVPQGERCDVNEVKKAIQNGMSYDEICDTHFETASRISKFIPRSKFVPVVT